MTTKNKLLLIGASSVGVLMIATLTVGVLYKTNKTAEYEALLTQQQMQMQAKAEEAAKEASSSTYEVPPIEPIKIQEAKRKLEAQKSAASSSAPEIAVSTDESGNQTITEEYEKPEPTEEELHNPEKEPTTPTKPDPKPDDDGVKYDDNGNQIPNEKGEIYLPGFGWTKSTGGETEHIDVELSGNLIGY